MRASPNQLKNTIGEFDMSLLIIYAHPVPRRSRVNELLKEYIPSGAKGKADVVVHDLYARYPDFDIDVPAEQVALSAAQHVVLQFPLHWYSVPALLKAWFDEVFLHGWAYGEGGTALHGKTLTVVTSAGGTAEAYQADGSNRRPLLEYLAPLEQTAHLCGMRWHPPLILYGADRASQQSILTHAEAYRARLSTLLGLEG
jgi:glutathione-regulated potassium-efflux system ancillary protein KefF